MRSANRKRKSSHTTRYRMNWLYIIVHLIVLIFALSASTFNVTDFQTHYDDAFDLIALLTTVPNYLMDLNSIHFFFSMYTVWHSHWFHFARQQCRLKCDRIALFSVFNSVEFCAKEKKNHIQHTAARTVVSFAWDFLPPASECTNVIYTRIDVISHLSICESAKASLVYCC